MNQSTTPSIKAIATVLLTSLILFSSNIGWASEPDSETPPNVVVILVDDLGYMDIGANNPNCFYETPNIDAFAKSGLRFTNGYAANPVCSPTRFSMLTGRYPTRVGATNFFTGNRKGKFAGAPLHNRMPLEEITLADTLKSKGYATFFAGKWHLGPTEEYFPHNRGFDVNMGGWNKGGPYTGKKYFAPFKNPFLIPESPAGEHLPTRLARETANFIDKNKEQPFFAYLSFYSVHTPLIGRPDLIEKYEARAEAIEGEEFGEEEQVFGKDPRKVRILQKHPVYAAMVEAMDEAVGVVLKQLEDSGVADNTIQWGLINKRRLTDLQFTASRRQGLDLRGRNSRAVDCPLPRRHQAGHHQRSAHLLDRCFSHNQQSRRVRN